ncbi:MAG TPA: pitrilysin family protein [Bryobacteraceae bacterium]|nr:pitrilysin family protein [Bryobacteraceae bacterium]
MRSALPLLLSLAASAATLSSLGVQIPIQQYKLPNGLRVVISEDRSAPTYSICVTYNVGSHNERPGRTGFAHLFEHMMFQGSEHVGKGEHSLLVENNGGSLNGTTNENRTNYFESFPSNQLDLGLYLEADRMRSLAVNQANLDNQRNAVEEERRLSIDNQPYGETSEVLQATAYDNFANKHSVIGSMEDLNAAKVEDVKEFFRVYYAPNNAVLVLVGDVKAADAFGRVKKYFGEIPAQPAPPPTDLTEPEQTAERRKTLEDKFAQSPRISIAFKVPPGNTPDWDAASLLSNVLAGGQSSRLYQTLVKDKEAAINVFSYVEESRGPSLFILTITARPGKDLGEIEKLVYAEISRLQNEPIADWELEKVRMTSKRRNAQHLEGTQFRAELIGQLAVYYGDPNLINTRFAKLQSVNKDDIQRVARKYLNASQRTVVVTLPKAGDTK